MAIIKVKLLTVKEDFVWTKFHWKNAVTDGSLFIWIREKSLEF